MSIILFTGAGASKPFGYPTTIEFFPNKKPADWNSADWNFFNNVRNYLGTEIVDVENILQLLEPCESFLKTEPGRFLSKNIGSQWQQLIPQLAETIRMRCFDVYGKIPEFTDVAELYRPLFSHFNWEASRLSLYTTNYDPVTDKLLELADKYNITANDGFNPRGTWDPSSYGNLKNGLLIYRLHGSMSWFKDGNQIKNLRAYGRFEGRADDHLLIYPGYKGNPEESDNEAFAFPHRSLRKDLETAKAFISIGFSFRDPHINKMLEEALSQNKNLNIIVVNPSWPKGPDVGLEKLKDWAPKRIIHVEGKFGDSETLIELGSVVANVPFFKRAKRYQEK